MYEALYRSYRGNIYGPDPSKENKPFYIKEALNAGYDVEIDVWWNDNQWMLGHDTPDMAVSEELLQMPGLWIHCKNVEALQRCMDLGLHCFFHVTDNATLTSRGFIWVYPGKTQTKNSIVVMPEWDYGDRVLALPECVGICSDQIWRYRHNGNNT